MEAFKIHSGVLKAVALAIVPLGLLAQMNGGLTGFGMMGQAMSGMGASGPVVGPDGTAYALRQATARMGMMGSVSTSGLELAAINPSDGTARWTLPLDGYVFSQPVLAPDGRIFLCDSEPGMMFDWMDDWWTDPRGDSARKSRLLVIETTRGNARIAAQVEIDADMLSQPVIASDGAGGYLVYVNTFDIGQGASMMSDNGSGAVRYLLAFRPDGTLKFKVKLGQMTGGPLNGPRDW